MKIPKKIKNIFTDVVHNNNQIINKSLNFIILFIVLFFIIIFQPPEIRVGQILHEDLIADQDIKYIDIEATKKREEIIKATTPPVFIYDLKIVREQHNLLKEIFEKVLSSKNYNEIKILLIENKINITSSEYKNLQELNDKYKSFENNFIYIFTKFYKMGLINIKESEISNYDLSGIIIGEYVKRQLKYTHYLTEEILNIERLKKNLNNEIENVFYGIEENKKNSLINLYIQFFIPNTYLDEQITNRRLNNRIQSESVVYKNVLKGEIVAKKGEVISKSLFEKINLVVKNKKDYFDLSKVFSTIFFLILILSFLYLFINSFEKKEFKDFKNYIFISIILIIDVIFFLIPIYLGYDKLSIYYGLFIPISAFSISFMFLFSRVHSAFFTTLLSFLLFFIIGFNNYALIFVFFSGILTIFFVSDINKRSGLLLASLVIFILNFLISLFIIFSVNFNNVRLSWFALFSFCNGVVSAILSIGIIIIGEKILNTSTVFRLQELSYFSSPLLKKLFNTAIGTYNHSITVGNLAESAAQEIGANALLAKVGGYYHDIGKLDNPEYFIENQKDFNKHNQLKPSISTAIIKAHVNIGVERGRKERLPQKVLDIIAQHHGKTLIKYFYEEAIKSSEPGKKEVQKFDYQYQSLNPTFPESSIVLLADQVEAATRALKKYTMTTIEKVIEKIVNDKFQEGILDDSGLTLKNITKIKRIFTKIVTSMYHPRIEYPETSNIENNQPKDKKNKKKKFNNIK